MRANQVQRSRWQPPNRFVRKEPQIFVGHAVLSSDRLIDCKSHARLILCCSVSGGISILRFLIFAAGARILHTFDLPKIVRMMTITMCCSENLANGVNDNYCSIFLQSSSVSSSLRDLGKQIAGSKLPGRLAQRWHSSGTTLVQRWHRSGTTLVQRWHNSSSPSSFPFPRRLRQQVAHPSTPDAIDLCLQAEEISRPQNPASYSRLWLPGSGDPRRDLDQNSGV